MERGKVEEGGGYEKGEGVRDWQGGCKEEEGSGA